MSPTSFTQLFLLCCCWCLQLLDSSATNSMLSGKSWILWIIQSWRNSWIGFLVWYYTLLLYIFHIQEEDRNRHLSQHVKTGDVNNSFSCTRTLRLQWRYQAASHCSRHQNVSRHHGKVLTCSSPEISVRWLWECAKHGQGERLCDQRHIWGLQTSKPAPPQSEWLGGEWDLWLTVLVSVWSLCASVKGTHTQSIIWNLQAVCIFPKGSCLGSYTKINKHILKEDSYVETIRKYVFISFDLKPGISLLSSAHKHWWITSV